MVESPKGHCKAWRQTHGLPGHCVPQELYLGIGYLWTINATDKNCNRALVYGQIQSLQLHTRLLGSRLGFLTHNGSPIHFIKIMNILY